MKTTLLCLTLVGLFITSALADVRTSASYSIPADVLDAGGAHAASASYSNDGSLGGIAGSSAAADASVKLDSGYIAQLGSAVAAGTNTLTPLQQWKLAYLGDANAPDTGDPDGDGQNNYFEYVAGTIPTNSASRFVFSISNSVVPKQRLLIFSPRLGDRTYLMQFTTNFTTVAFSNLVTTTTSDAGTTRTVTDTNATATTKFYRVSISYP
jgi:hypothetical protein